MMGFQSGCMGSVPIIQGIVTAKENEENIRSAWKEMEERRIANAEKKRIDAMQSLWRTLVKGTIVRHRIMVEKHAEQPKSEGKPKKVRRVAVQFSAAPHNHHFVESVENNVCISRCECGFTLEEEDL
jgi:hypothetical protein